MSSLYCITCLFILISLHIWHYILLKDCTALLFLGAFCSWRSPLHAFAVTLLYSLLQCISFTPHVPLSHHSPTSLIIETNHSATAPLECHPLLGTAPVQQLTTCCRNGLTGVCCYLLPPAAMPQTLLFRCLNAPPDGYPKPSAQLTDLGRSRIHRSEYSVRSKFFHLTLYWSGVESRYGLTR